MYFTGTIYIYIYIYICRWRLPSTNKLLFWNQNEKWYDLKPMCIYGWVISILSHAVCCKIQVNSHTWCTVWNEEPHPPWWATTQLCGSNFRETTSDRTASTGRKSQRGGNAIPTGEVVRWVLCFWSIDEARMEQRNLWNLWHCTSVWERWWKLQELCPSQKRTCELRESIT